MSNVAPAARSDRIDALKFFAIALVVLGHVANLSRYDNVLGDVVYVIRSINMPLFMFLSGYVLLGREGSSPLPFIKRKFLALIVPYFAWVVFGLLLSEASTTGWLRALGDAAVQPHVSGRKWFLYVLFLFYVLFTLSRLVSRSDVWLLIIAAGTIYLTFLPDGDLLGRLDVQWLFAFFVAGYLAAKHRARLPAANLRLAVVVAVAFGVLLAVGWLPDRGTGWPPWFFAHSGGFFARWWQWSRPAFLLWKYATAFAGIALSVLLYSLVDVRWLGWQAMAGRHSLGIYVTQGWLLSLATGSSALATLGSWVLVVYVSLAVALLLDTSVITRVLLLGRPARTRDAVTGSPSPAEAG